jgi:hypothetical protein
MPEADQAQRPDRSAVVSRSRPPTSPCLTGTTRRLVARSSLASPGGGGVCGIWNSYLVDHITVSIATHSPRPSGCPTWTAGPYSG